MLVLETHNSAYFVCLSYSTTPDLDHQLIRRELPELNYVCQIREAYKICSAVGL